MVFLIDTENVGRAWLKLLEICDSKDEFVLFYTSNTMPYTLDVFEQMMGSNCDMELVSCNVGRNALDFQLVSDLSVRASENPQMTYSIVSWDKGFGVAINYLRARGYDVHRIELPREEVKLVKEKTVKTDAKPEPQAVSNKIKPIYADIDKAMSRSVPDWSLYFSKDVADKVTKIMKNAGCVAETKRKAHVCQQLTAAFDAKKGLFIYNIIKPYIK